MAQTENRTIFVVDDTPVNIDMLDDILNKEYNVRVALDGETALKMISKGEMPDLILLDIIMPGMDGYEVCRRLKENKATRGIPIIFVTSVTGFEGEVKGLDLGAVDYITKPFDPTVVKARVRTQMELKMYRDHIESLAEARARQLVHAERLSTLGMLSAGIAHEISNPLTYIMSNASIIKIDLENLQDTVAQALEYSDPYKKSIDEITRGCKESILEVIDGSNRIVSLVRNMKHLSRHDEETKTQIDPGRCVENALNLCQFDLKMINVHLDIDDDLPRVTGNMQQIEQVLINLFKNAVDALETVKPPEISITAKAGENAIWIRVADNGPGIKEANLPSIWEAFYTTKTEEKGTGLGLSISKGIIENHGGKIRVQNLNPQGVCFTIELPVADALTS